MHAPIHISAVIPTYNRGHVIGRAIESALAQGNAPAEIIVVDDGSTDNTRSIVNSYGNRVRYLYQANAGVSAARNRGVREARFEWIAFLDSDDYWMPEHLTRILNAIVATGGGAALYFSDLRVPQEEGGYQYWDRCGLEISGEFEFRRDAGEWAFMPIQPTMLDTSVIRRSSYWEVGGFSELLRTREDTLLFYKLTLLYPACAVSGCGAVMNSDDCIRLTHVYDGNSPTYRKATIFLYRELLTTVKNLDRVRRRLLVESLAGSYFSEGRVFLRQKKLLNAIRSLLIACAICPPLFAKELLGSLVRRLPGLKRGSRPSSTCPGLEF